MQSRVSTDAVSEAESLDFWQEVVCRTFFVADCLPLSERAFHGATDTGAPPPIAFSRIRSREQRVIRTSQHVRQTAEEVFLVNLQVSGKGGFDQDGRQTVLE